MEFENVREVIDFLFELADPSTMMFSSPIFGDMFLLLFDQLVDISTIIDIFNGTLNGQ